MAVLHKKEEKIQAVLGRLPKKYTHEQFVEMFIKVYSKDWGKIKSAYIKQSQDKEPGTVINMPKPEIYLKQILAIYLQQADEPKSSAIAAEESVIQEAPKVELKKEAAKKSKEETTAVKQPKTAAKSKISADEKPGIETKKPKAPTKKKAEDPADVSTEIKKPKATAKKTAEKK